MLLEALGLFNCFLLLQLPSAFPSGSSTASLLLLRLGREPNCSAPPEWTARTSSAVSSSVLRTMLPVARWSSGHLLNTKGFGNPSASALCDLLWSFGLKCLSEQVSQNVWRMSQLCTRVTTPLSSALEAKLDANRPAKIHPWYTSEQERTLSKRARSDCRLNGTDKIGNWKGHISGTDMENFTGTTHTHCKLKHATPRESN